LPQLLEIRSQYACHRNVATAIHSPGFGTGKVPPADAKNRAEKVLRRADIAVMAKVG
jgi:hypothetical protein